MGVNKVVYSGQTLIDLTSDTVTADTLMEGYTAHAKDGSLVTGTATGSAILVDGEGYVAIDYDKFNY